MLKYYTQIHCEPWMAMDRATFTDKLLEIIWRQYALRSVKNVCISTAQIHIEYLINRWWFNIDHNHVTSNNEYTHSICLCLTSDKLHAIWPAKHATRHWYLVAVRTKCKASLAFYMLPVTVCGHCLRLAYTVLSKVLDPTMLYCFCIYMKRSFFIGEHFVRTNQDRK